MNGNSIEFGEVMKKLCQKMCSVRMVIWSAVKQPLKMQAGICGFL